MANVNISATVKSIHNSVSKPGNTHVKMSFGEAGAWFEMDMPVGTVNVGDSLEIEADGMRLKSMYLKVPAIVRFIHLIIPMIAAFMAGGKAPTAEQFNAAFSELLTWVPGMNNDALPMASLTVSGFVIVKRNNKVVYTRGEDNKIRDALTSVLINDEIAETVTSAKPGTLSKTPATPKAKVQKTRKNQTTVESAA